MNATMQQLQARADALVNLRDQAAALGHHALAERFADKLAQTNAELETFATTAQVDSF